MKFITKEQRDFALALATVAVDRVDELVAVKGLTKREVGTLCGVKNPKYAGQWWSNIRKKVLQQKNPNIMLLQIARLATRLGINPAELVTPFKNSHEETLLKAADAMLREEGKDPADRKPSPRALRRRARRKGNGR